jgi:hypothetical protein
MLERHGERGEQIVGQPSEEQLPDQVAVGRSSVDGGPAAGCRGSDLRAGLTEARRIGDRRRSGDQQPDVVERPACGSQPARAGSIRGDHSETVGRLADRNPGRECADFGEDDVGQALGEVDDVAGNSFARRLHDPAIVGCVKSPLYVVLGRTAPAQTLPRSR